jgi:hypothetical protein
MKSKVVKLERKIDNLNQKIVEIDGKEVQSIDDIIESICSFVTKQYNDIYQNSLKIHFDNDMMPVVSDKSLSEISSASEKVVIRLLVVYSYLKYSKSLNLKHPGFILLDSPRDKDLDFTKYRKIIDIIDKTKEGQIFFTGSIEDKSQFSNNILLEMIAGEKLLKQRKIEKSEE